MPLCFFNNPILLAVVAVAAVGLVIYEIVTENNNRYQNVPPPRRDEGRGSFPRVDVPSHDSSTPSESLSTKANKKRKRYKKSPTSTSASSFNSPEHSNPPTDSESTDESESVSVIKSHSSFQDSSVRKRHVGQNSLEAKGSYTHVFDEKFDKNNYCQNVLDKLNNDVKIIDENTTKNLVCNIPVGESDSSENEEEKLINKMICNENDPSSNPFGTETHEEISNPLSNSSSNSEDTVNVTNAECLKMIEHDMPENNVQDEKEMNAESSDTVSREEKIAESRFCKACEEKPSDTFARPCNHSYLCSDCALKVFRLYKKCSICLKKVDRFVQSKYE